MFSKLKRARAELHGIFQSIQELRARPDLSAAVEDIRTRISPATWVPPGHFYSPLVDTAELEKRHSIFDRTRAPEAIDMNEAGQLATLARLSAHYPRLPFQDQPSEGLRYHYENPHYSYGDAITLATMMMEFRPRRIVEVGSGYSSAMMLDINERFFGGATKITFVEPYPDLLHSKMTPEDRERHRVIASGVQDLDLAVTDELEAGDFLFIDSTHVMKAGSDVHFELFTLLPRLKPGVLIHFHDMFYPFEYPKEWFFRENRSWNEIYALRAFLMHNGAYEIVFFSHYIALAHRERVHEAMPLFTRNAGGNLWLRKLH